MVGTKYLDVRTGLKLTIGQAEQQAKTLSDAAANPPTFGPRQLACARCGKSFACNVGGPCWCGEVEVMFPLPKSGEPSPTGFDDCICADCLRALADENARKQRAEAGRAT